MININLADLTLEAFKKGKRLIAPLMGYPGVRLIESNIKLSLQNYDIHFKALKSLSEAFQPDMIFPLMQLTTEANALGMETVFPVDDVPQLKEGGFNLDKLDRELEKLNKIDILCDSRIICSTEAVKRIARGLPEEILKGAYVIGPYSLAAMMLGAENALMASLIRSDDLEVLCSFTTEKIKEYANQLIRAGAQVICILEPTAMMLYPEQFHQFSAFHVGNIARSCKENFGINSIYHICGNTMAIVSEMIESGVDGISIDSKEAGIDMKKVLEIAENLGKNIVIVGNISPTETMLYKKPAEIKKEVNDLLETMKSYPYFVLSTGCELPPETPRENIAAFMDAGREYNLKHEV